MNGTGNDAMSENVGEGEEQWVRWWIDSEKKGADKVRPSVK